MDDHSHVNPQRWYKQQLVRPTCAKPSTHIGAAWGLEWGGSSGQDPLLLPHFLLFQVWVGPTSSCHPCCSAPQVYFLWTASSSPLRGALHKCALPGLHCILNTPSIQSIYPHLTDKMDIGVFCSFYLQSLPLQSTQGKCPCPLFPEEASSNVHLLKSCSLPKSGPY